MPISQKLSDPRTDTDYSTKELSKQTWRDFERLFKKSGEWETCWCMYYHRAKPIPNNETRMLSADERQERNRREHKELVNRRRAHGILVYAGSEPVGWCQFGAKEELPRIDAGRKYKNLSLNGGQTKLWRITCFCVDKKYRKKGVANIALRAALESIKGQGGGIVEAYPITREGALGSWFGTVSMFEGVGFKVAAQFGKSMVLMRKSVHALRGKAI